MDEMDVGGTIALSQPLGVALQVSPALQRDEADGVIGLAASSLNTSMSSLMFTGSQHLIIRTVMPTPRKTFFQTAWDQGVLEQAVFTVDLQWRAPGSYDFGFIDDTKYIGPITYVP